jgi:hypothetical protein
VFVIKQRSIHTNTLSIKHLNYRIMKPLLIKKLALLLLLIYGYRIAEFSTIGKHFKGRNMTLKTITRRYFLSNGVFFKTINWTLKSL